MQLEQIVPNGETVLERCHPHPITLVGPGLRSLVLVGLGLALVWGSGQLAGSAQIPDGATPGLGLVATAIPWLTRIGWGMQILAGGLVLGTWWQWRATEYAVTEPAPAGRPGNGRSLIHIWGRLRRDAVMTPLWQVNDLQLDLPVLGQLLGYGTIRIITGNDLVQVLAYVPQAQAFYQICQSGRSLPSNTSVLSMAVAPGTPAPPTDPAARW